MAKIVTRDMRCLPSPFNIWRNGLGIEKYERVGTDEIILVLLAFDDQEKRFRAVEKYTFPTKNSYNIFMDRLEKNGLLDAESKFNWTLNTLFNGD